MRRRQHLGMQGGTRRDVRRLLKQVDLPMPYNEDAWVERVAAHIGRPIETVDMTDADRARAQERCPGHVWGCVMNTPSGGVRMAVQPRLPPEVRQATVLHELAHLLFGDIPIGRMGEEEAVNRFGLSPGLASVFFSEVQAKSIQRTPMEQRVERFADLVSEELARYDERTRGQKSGDSVTDFWHP